MTMIQACRWMEDTWCLRAQCQVHLSAKARGDSKIGPSCGIVGADGIGPRPLFSGEVRNGDFRYVEFSVPHLSLDNRYVYFAIPLAAVCSGLVRLDRRTSEVRILTPAKAFTVIESGKYRGYLVVDQTC